MNTSVQTATNVLRINTVLLIFHISVTKKKKINSQTSVNITTAYPNNTKQTILYC